MNQDVAKELLELRDKLLAQGKAIKENNLRELYDRFREKFSPQVLSGMDGEALLLAMHGGQENDSLTYWLEFKNDEEFPSPSFGTIGGGSALKFGIYRRKEDGTWMTGSPKKQIPLELNAAIDLVRKQRDELLTISQIIANLPDIPSDQDWFKAQAEMLESAPTVADKSWTHKYFHMMFPDKVDVFHAPSYQRWHLIRILETPPQEEGRYACAGRYVAMRSELSIPMQHLGAAIYKRNGSPYYYWRVGTTEGGGGKDYWPLMSEGNYISVGWPELADLSELVGKPEAVDTLKEMLATNYPKADPRTIGKDAKQIRYFLTDIQEGDLVFACNGMAILGIGRVTGGYRYEPNLGFPHLRNVEWLDLDPWKMFERDCLRTTVCKMKKPVNLVEAERRITEHKASPSVPKLTGIPERINAILERKSQVILYGPPGTGKTHWAFVAARELASLKNLGKPFSQCDEQEAERIENQKGQGWVQACTFHPSYGYEDFLEGYRPAPKESDLNFELKPGIFKNLCRLADENPVHSYYLIIDEINRGDIPRIFGELLTVLEKDKRGRSILLPLSGEAFSVPKNVFVIGTMNTADRSIALLDTALRRRFGFIELMPDYSVLGSGAIRGLPLGPWLKALNRKILGHAGRDARNLQIGHSYLLSGKRPVADFSELARILREDIIPLLEEYCYEDYSALEAILGKDIVDLPARQIREDLFTSAGHDNLLQALLAMDPSLTSSLEAQGAVAEEDEDEEEMTEDE